MAIINISRQPYSCGNKVAGEIAEKLNYKLIDKFVINGKIKEFHCNFSDELHDLASEKEPGFFKNFFTRPRVYNSLLQAIFFEEASNDNVVILGRGGQYVLGHSHVLNVRIISPEKNRRANVETKEAVNPSVAEHLLEKKDHQRDNFIQYVFKKDVSDADAYDLIFNQDKLGSDVIASTILELVARIEKDQPLTEDDKDKLKRQSLEKRVEATIRKKHADVVHLDVSCEELGKIKVAGFVEDEMDRNEVFKLAQSCRGVESVDNELSTIRLHKP